MTCSCRGLTTIAGRSRGRKAFTTSSATAVYLSHRSPKYEEWESFDPYQEKYEHDWWKPLRRKASPAPREERDLDKQLALGHGGTDYVELTRFLAGRAQQNADSQWTCTIRCCMSVICPLSEKSIAEGGSTRRLPGFHAREMADEEAKLWRGKLVGHGTPPQMRSGGAPSAGVVLIVC